MVFLDLCVDDEFEECEEDPENHSNLLRDYVIEDDDDDIVV